MIQKICNQCGRFCWHNLRRAKDGASHRCTFCGFPVVSGSPKREHNENTMRRQSAQRK